MKKVHFIGICGKGMSAVAKLLIDLGYTVTGSDEGFYPPVSTYIEENKIPFIKGYKKENIDHDVDTIVISKHAKLVASENEEVAQAFLLKEEGKVEIKSFPEILETITKDRESLVVVGSFGKSTCTSLLAHILEFNNLDIGYFIGATPITPKLNAHIGSHKNFILEGDEYPSANWDETSKFMYYNAHDVLLTALAHDHVNIFKTHEEFKKTFFKLIEKIPTEGLLVYNLDEINIKEEEKNILEMHENSISYAVLNTNAKYFVKNINYGEQTNFEVYKGDMYLGKLETGLLGEHNIQNILGVVVLILEKKLLNFEQIREAVKFFISVTGRLNQLETKSGFKIYEGFGSSIDKAKSAISAIKKHFPEKKLKIIFEPYTFSWRSMDAISWYDNVFDGAEKVYVYEPPTHGATTHAQLTQEQIINRIKESGVSVMAINDKKQAIESILNEVDLENDIILTLSPSNIDDIPKEIADLI